MRPRNKFGVTWLVQHDVFSSGGGVYAGRFFQQRTQLARI